MNALRLFVPCCLLSSFCPGPARAQPASWAGALTYRADTVRRVEPQPAGYLPAQLLVYHRGDSTRLELLRVSRRNPADTERAVHLRVPAGTYTWIEYADPRRAAAGNFALFESYASEERQQAARDRASGEDQPAQVVQRLPWLGLPAERRAWRAGPRAEPTEAVTTQALRVPLGGIFWSVRALPGTPLQFTHSESGWLTRYTATALRAQPPAKALFAVDPRRPVLSEEDAHQRMADFK